MKLWKERKKDMIKSICKGSVRGWYIQTKFGYKQVVRNIARFKSGGNGYKIMKNLFNKWE